MLWDSYLHLILFWCESILVNVDWLLSIHPFTLLLCVFPQFSEKCWRVFYWMTGQGWREKENVGCKFARHTDTRVLARGISSEKWEMPSVDSVHLLFALFICHTAPTGISFYFSVIGWMPATRNNVFCVDSRLIETFFRNTAFLVLQSGQGEETSTQITNTKDQVWREAQKFQEVRRRERFLVS